MRWEFSTEQRMFAEALDDWLGKQCTSTAIRRWFESNDPHEYERALATDSWLGVGLPEEIGGQGGGLIELALAAEAFGRFVAPSSGWLASVLAMPALVGAPESAAAAISRGRFVAFVVPADSPPDTALSVTFEGGRVRGHVSNVLGADRSSHLIAPVLADGELRLALVNQQAATVSSRRLLDRSRTVADVALHDAAAILLQVDAAAVLAEATLRAAVLVAADALGAMDRMLSMAVSYSKQRHQFGVPIGSFQAVKHAAATMLVGVEAARSIVYFAAASVDQQHSDRAVHAAVAKAQVVAEAKRAADSALTLHGAIGYTWELDLQLFYKRAMLDGPLFGTPVVWNERLASLLPLRGPVR
jgi:alkylation response protein AidB-like acyl-CoA dehydrogenase